MSAHPGRRLVINTSSLAAASFWRIFVSFALQLLVARQLDASALGVFALMLAWLQIAQIMGEAGLPQWLAREGAALPDRRGTLHRHTLILQVAFAAAAGVLLVVVALLLPQWMPPLSLVLLSALSLPFYAVMSSCLALFESAESFERVFVVDVATNTLLLLSSALLLLAGYPLWTLFAALLVCQMFSALLAFILATRSGLTTRAHGDADPSWRATLLSSKAYLSIALADVFEQRADLLIVGAIASPAATGIYAAAVSIVRVLVKLVQAYWRALFSTLSRLFTASVPSPRAATDAATRPIDSAERLYLLALRYVLIAAIAVAIVIGPLAQPVIALLYGSEFLEAASILALLVWSAPLYAWEVGAITRLLAEQRPRDAVNTTLVHLGLILLLLPLLGWRYGGLGAAVASVVAAGGGALAGAWWLRAWNDSAIRSVLLRLFGCAAGALLAGSAVTVLLPAGNLLVEATAAASTYVLSLIATRLIAAKDLSRLRGAIGAKS